MPGLIAITPRSLSAKGHPALARLAEAGFDVVYPAPGRQPSEAELLAALPNCVGMVAGVEPISARVLDASRNLRVISRNGTGVDNIDLAAAERHGISVCKAMGANSRGVAELAIGLMLNCLRHVAWSDHRLKQGKWQRKTGLEAEGRTLGVIGCGGIGRTVSQLALAIGMQMRAFDPLADQGFAPGPGFSFCSLESLMEADVITLHCPPAPRPLIDAGTLARMRKGVAIVNTARAELVDGEALLAALEEGHVSAYATDVYPMEPPEMSPLLRHENVIMTPHAGGLTEESVERATRLAVDNLLKALA